jgi:hypothetical protein
MVEQLRPTFAEQDRIRAARELKAVECIERLKRILVAEFDADEMRFIRNWDADSISRLGVPERAGRTEREEVTSSVLAAPADFRVSACAEPRAATESSGGMDCSGSRPTAGSTSRGSH